MRTALPVVNLKPRSAGEWG